VNNDSHLSLENGSADFSGLRGQNRADRAALPLVCGGEGANLERDPNRVRPNTALSPKQGRFGFTEAASASTLWPHRQERRV